MEGGRVGGRGEAGMMLCRERASVEEERVEGGMVDEGNERGRDGTGYGRPRERGEGGSERRMDRARKEGSMGGRERGKLHGR